MREVREQLAAGLSPQEAETLRVRVQRLLMDTENICRRQGKTPRDLARPSWAAYTYLAGLDLDRPPLRTGPGLAAPAPVRVARLIRNRDAFQGRLTSLARKLLDRQFTPMEVAAELPRLREQAIDIAGEISVLCERAGLSPAYLPEPSRRAYQWFSFLAEGDRLNEHVHALARAMAVDPRPAVELYHTADLYRVWRNGESIRLTASEAFVDAPAEVLRALVKVALPYTRKRLHREAIDRHVESEAFQETLLALELSGGAYETQSRGQCFDLDEVYRRVNDEYFGGQMGRPRLAWSQSVTLREFGHYRSSGDVLVLSMTLDSPDVPAFVVDYVMYHELLHKRLGARRIRGRRMVHTRAFRELERRFRRYAEAEAFLTRYARRLDRGASEQMAL